MPKKCLVINLDRCTGCDSCIVSCKFENSLPLGVYYNRVLAVGPTGTYPDIERYNLPVQCQQCEHPRCIEVCPTGASYRDTETGVVLVNRDECIHQLPAPDGEAPLTRYILSPKYASWKENL